LLENAYQFIASIQPYPISRIDKDKQRVQH